MGRFDGVLLCSDVDGTLAIGKEIPQRNLDAIAYFQSEGGRFTLATGRPAGYQHTFPFRVNAPVVSDNGACITDCDSGRVIWTFPLDGCGALLEWLDQSTAPICTFDFADELVRAAPGNVVETFLGHKGADLFKIVCHGFASEEEAVVFRDLAKETFGERYGISRSWSTGVEFISPLGGKGNCVSFLRKICDDVHTVVAVGDYENDVAMLLAADLAFAPSNACPEVCAVHPNPVCSCREGAVGDVIDELARRFG